ncbi:chromosome segregation protein [Scopulibacillus daqui]|uniref:Chromosome partition protein Smc n=1 Tax=Scopulibacillus daqui TaxID=1469162 RepID=A0ABS2PWB0_9BACL|nr:chromosome segregation protein SMC [Scopulibacillus daqui]MBM7644328.1 chromosome segregation protein [Scopulibacillus daqui]
MFLKQLEVMGFKSFAKKATIDFVPGVTAVVGPNGSGKSNITDAIRWVLGEQSARSLRGSKMEDIIFAGSDSKKPLNMAEVTLILDNSDQYLPYDFSEISVTRRVYRSGDSEFLINGQVCRLKDIVELFMDSGVGREAYSIIGQGKIDDILNSKADEKRKIFEEAAGVLKYKTRKHAAEKKLSESQDHLHRVEDILYELQDQVGPLEEQASIAKDYLEKKDKLKNVEVGLLAYDIEQTHQMWEQKNKEINRLTSEKNEWSKKIKKKERLYKKQQDYLKALDESIEELQEALLLSSETLEKFEGQKNVLEERQKNAKDNAEQLQERIDQLERKQEESIKALDIEQKNLRNEEEKWRKLQKQLKEKSKQYDYYNQDLDDIIDQLKSDYIDVLNDQATVRNEIRYLTEQKEQIQKKKERLEQQTSDIKQVIADVKERKNRLTALLRSLNQELEKKQTAHNQLRTRLADDEESYNKQSQALQKVASYIQQASSRKEMLEAMSQEYEGFFQGVKKVLKAKDQGLPGIHGAVAEIIKVDKDFETAIETALGSTMQHIVVEEESHARGAIQYLKQQRAGRATFLPMSVVKPRRVSSHDLGIVQSNEAFVGVASTLVQFQPVYENIVHHLLGHIIIAKHLKGANDLARLLGYRYRIVTLEGDVVSPGGAMTGGSQKQKSINLLGRNREIDQLSRQINEMKGKKQELEGNVAALKQQLTANQSKFEECRDDIQKLTYEKQLQESSLREIEIEEKNIFEKSGVLKREESDFEEELGKIEARIGELEMKQKENRQKEDEMNQEITALSKQKEHQQSSKEQIQSEVTELKIKVAEQHQIVKHQRDKTERMTEQLEAISFDLNEAKHAVENLDNHLNNQVVDQETMGEKIEQCRKDKQALSEWLKIRKAMRSDLYEQLDQQDASLKTDKRKQQAVIESLQAEEIALSKLDVQLDNLLNALREDYEMSFETAKAKYPLQLEPDEARKQVKLTKRAIEELGTVNIGAIDEYERVSERLNFLTEQREDLLNAKATLLNVIEEMDQEVKHRFKETFIQVREHFQEIFKALFGGGKADLQLTDPDDLLYSGVDILAQPPGKKLQHLSLLSGGERALTAIALLFAILKVRPVPFCVLDEVEAALDDANVDRYADYLKNFSRETQFIVVTHRKGTMEKADVLYGVTMQESGVSKLVSVRLEETKELMETT